LATFASVGEAGGQQAPASTAGTEAPEAPAAPAAPKAPDAPDAPDTSEVVSFDRIRAGLQRKPLIAGEPGTGLTPMFRTEVTGHVIKLRDYWSDRDPDMEPDPFMYPVPSAAELLIRYSILKPRAALRARKQRALKKQIAREIEQIEQQREATVPPATAATPGASSTPPAASPTAPPSSPPR
jgi:hypothetical protein